MLYLLAGCRQPVHHRRRNGALDPSSGIRPGFHQGTSGRAATDLTAVPNTDTARGRRLGPCAAFGLEMVSEDRTSVRSHDRHPPIRVTQHAVHQTSGQGLRRLVHSCTSTRYRPFRKWFLIPIFLRSCSFGSFGSSGLSGFSSFFGCQIGRAHV